MAIKTQINEMKEFIMNSDNMTTIKKGVMSVALGSLLLVSSFSNANDLMFDPSPVFNKEIAADINKYNDDIENKIENRILVGTNNKIEKSNNDEFDNNEFDNDLLFDPSPSFDKEIALEINKYNDQSSQKSNKKNSRPRFKI